MENYYFFWKSKLSNWADSRFTVNDVQFHCGEQYMMYQKAMLFKDTEIANLIMNSISPRDIKALGRSVKNFDGSVWDKHKYSIVKFGLKARFEQDKYAQKELLKHKGEIFVEASPYDRIWGIGYSKETAMANKANWGENLLGKILTEISMEL